MLYKIYIERNGDSTERKYRPDEQACPGTSRGTRVYKEFAVVLNGLKTKMIVNYDETN